MYCFISEVYVDNHLFPYSFGQLFIIIIIIINVCMFLKTRLLRGPLYKGLASRI